MQQIWSIRSRAHECALTGRPFEDGEVFHTAIYFDPQENGYVRRDVSREAWKDAYRGQGWLGALGMDWSALFPVDWAGRKFKKTTGIPASDVLNAIEFESLVIAIIAHDMHQKREISEADYRRLERARKRINAARSAHSG